MTEKEYSTELQKLFLEIMLSDAQCFVRVQNIYNFENFDRSLQRPAQYIKKYSEQYNDLPTTAQVRAETGVDFKPVPEITQSITEWFLDEFEGFTRHQTLKRVILESADLIGRGEYEPIENMVKKAVQISLTRDLGTDYFDDPRGRLMKLKSNNGQMSTGWPMLDHKLFGGFNRGELEIFAGSSGSGKSLIMQNLAVNWMQSGIPGVYITLELSEELCAMRIDSMTVGVSTREIFKELDTVEMQVRMAGKKGGSLRIKYMPAQSNSNDIRSYLNELQIQTGIKPMYVCVDYLDLLMPSGVKVSPNDLFIKDKYVSEELRNLAKEMDLVLVTASQLNRCLTPDTIVQKPNGFCRLSDVSPGDQILGPAGFVEVKKVHPTIKQPVFEVTTASGKKIRCSAKHKFPTSHGLKDLSDGLAVGHKLLVESDQAKPQEIHSDHKKGSCSVL